MNEPQGHRPVSTTEIVAGEVRAYLGRRRLSGRAAAMQLGWTQQYMSRRLTGAIPFDVADLAAEVSPDVRQRTLSASPVRNL
jgi:hypothetical protein